MSTVLSRWSPLREMATMHNLMNRLFDEDFRTLGEEANLSTNPLALDVYEGEHGFTVTTELPGVKAENIHIKQDGDFLVIDAEIPAHTTEREGERALIRERRYGRFSRRMRLPQHIDFNSATADYVDGVLTLTLPKAAEPAIKTIPVNVGSNGANGTVSAENTQES